MVALLAVLVAAAAPAAASGPKGAIGGTVRDSSGRALRGAAVTVCDYAIRATCRTATTGPGGGYRAGGLPPATYQVEVYPGRGDLEGTATVTVAGAGSTTQDFELRAPAAAPSALVVDGHTGGVETSYWNAPTSVQDPLELPAHGVPGTFGETRAVFNETPAGSPDAAGEAIAGISVLYAYGRDGRPVFVASAQDRPLASLRRHSGAATGAAPVLGSFRLGLTTAAVTGSTGAHGLELAGLLTPAPARAGSYFHGATTISVTQSVRTFTAAPGSSGVRGDAGEPDLPEAAEADEPLLDQPSPLPIGGVTAGSVKAAADPQAELELAAQRYAASHGLRARGTASAPGETPTGLCADDATAPRYLGHDQWRLPDGGTLAAHAVDGVEDAVLTQPAGAELHIVPADAAAGGVHVTIDYPDGAVYDLAHGTYTDAHGDVDAARSQSRYEQDGRLIDTNVGLQVGLDGQVGLTDGAGHLRYAIDARDGALDDVASGARYYPDGTVRSASGSTRRASISAACGGASTSRGHYVDPSGHVLTKSGIPVAGASVTLEHSATLRGVLTALQNGAVSMSAANRRNPVTTDAFGRFGWDVRGGYYRAAATRGGCTAVGSRQARVQTGRLKVPPPAAQLRLRLHCPKLRRVAAKVSVAAFSQPLKQVVLSARLQSSGRTKVNEGDAIVFSSGGRRIALVPVDVRSGIATFEAAADAVVARTVTASFGGDGLLAPARASAAVEAPKRARK